MRDITSPPLTSENESALSVSIDKVPPIAGKCNTSEDRIISGRPIHKRPEKGDGRGNSDDKLTAQIRLTRLNDEYLRFSHATGLRTQRERAQVAGFGREETAQARTVLTDGVQWKKIQQTIGSRAPKSLAEFREIKYTNSKEWGRLMRNQTLFEKIDSTPTYTPEYRGKLKDAYCFFRDAGFEFREHALNRVLGQKTSKGKIQFTDQTLLDVLKREANYRQPDGKLVRFYESITAVSAQDTDEIVTIVVRNTPRKDWEAL